MFADMDPDADPQLPDRDGIPSVEQARLFAAAILDESEKQESKRKIYDTNHPPFNFKASSTTTSSPFSLSAITGRTNNNDSWGSRNYSRGGIMSRFHQNQESSSSFFNNSCPPRCSMLCCCAITFVIVLIVFVGLDRTIGGGCIDILNTDRMDTLVSLLSEKGISDHHLLTTPGTPQHSAVHWLADVDELQLNIPPDTTNSTIAITAGGNGNGEEEEDVVKDIERIIQRYSLAVLYFSLNGGKADDQRHNKLVPAVYPNTIWTNDLKFMTPTLHECSWYHPIPDEIGDTYAVGVTCNDELQVTKLLLPGNNLKGTIPVEIGQLVQLDFICMKHNSITGTIPTSMSKLTKLKYLDVKVNEISGTIPNDIGTRLTNLQVLGLSYNQFIGSIPASISFLHKLRTLAIGHNLLIGDIRPISKLTNLEYLYAEANDFTSYLDNTGPPLLGHHSSSKTTNAANAAAAASLLDDLTKLIEVDLSYNNLKSTNLPMKLFTMSHLRSLDLSYNDIGGTLPVMIDGSTTNDVLQFLSLRRNVIRGPIPTKLVTHLIELIHLDLEENSFTGIVPEGFFKGLSHMKNLALGKNPFDAWPMYPSMADMAALKTLSLHNAHLTGTIPSFVSSEVWQHLIVLDLHHNKLSGPVPERWNKLQKLSVLLLNDNELNGTIPFELTTLPELDVLTLHRNSFLTDDDVGGLLCPANDEPPSLWFTSDCDAITTTCDCCPECCNSDECYSDVVWDDICRLYSPSSWKENFLRADYSFNPHIVDIDVPS